jgi:hypothetical protein
MERLKGGDRGVWLGHGGDLGGDGAGGSPVARLVEQGMYGVAHGGDRLRVAAQHPPGAGGSDPFSVGEVVGGLRQHEQRPTVTERAEDGPGAAVADNRAATRQDLRLRDERRDVDVRRRGTDCGGIEPCADVRTSGSASSAKASSTSLKSSASRFQTVPKVTYTMRSVGRSSSHDGGRAWPSAAIAADGRSA